VSKAHRDSLTHYLDNKPSLLQGSAIRVTISRFKPDPTDHTIGLSILTVLFGCE